MLELAKNIAQLDKAGELLEEIIIVKNASTESYNEVKYFIVAVPEIPSFIPGLLSPHSLIKGCFVHHKYSYNPFDKIINNSN